MLRFEDTNKMDVEKHGVMYSRVLIIQHAVSEYYILSIVNSACSEINHTLPPCNLYI